MTWNVFANGEDIGHVHSFDFELVGPLPENIRLSMTTDKGIETTVEWKTGMPRYIAAMFGVPPWLIGIGKRPRKHARGQRKTGHHRPHRRR